MRTILLILTHILLLNMPVSANGIGIFSEPMQSPYRIYPGQENDQKTFSFSLYSKPRLESKTKRTFIKENFYGHPDKTYMINGSAILMEDGHKISITNSSSHYSSVIKLSFEEFYLTFSERVDDFIKVRLVEKEYWLSVNEIESIGLELILWSDYFRIGSDFSISALEDIPVFGVAHSEEKIFTMPKHHFSKIDVESPYYLIESILIIDGEWMQVAVKKWRKWDDWTKGRPVEDTVIGWIKFIDENSSTRIFSSQNFGC